MRIEELYTLLLLFERNESPGTSEQLHEISQQE
jgi:hypothetical protein